MKLAKSLLISATVLATLGVTHNKVFAANLGIAEAQLVNPPADATVIGICRNFNQCKLDDVLNQSVPQGFTSAYVNNDTGFDITKTIYTILPDQDIVWDPNSNYRFFGKRELSPDGKTIAFSDGVFPAGSTGFFTRVNDIPVRFTVSIEGKAVPESSTTLGVIAVGCMLFMLSKRMKKAAVTE